MGNLFFESEFLALGVTLDLRQKTFEAKHVISFWVQNFCLSDYRKSLTGKHPAKNSKVLKCFFILKYENWSRTNSGKSSSSIKVSVWQTVQVIEVVMDAQQGRKRLAC